VPPVADEDDRSERDTACGGVPEDFAHIGAFGIAGHRGPVAESFEQERQR